MATVDALWVCLMFMIRMVAFLLGSNSLKLLNYSLMNTNFMFTRSGVL